MKNLNKILLFTLFMAGFTATAQVKVGDNAAAPMNTSAVLELESTDKGLLLPRVALTATNAFAPLSAHVAGMKVYNTATAGTAPYDVTPGEYYNDGVKWVKVAPAAQVFKPTKNVYVDVANPNSATKWGEVRYLNYDATTSGCITNPSFVDDPLLANNTTYMYMGQSTCDEDGDGAEYSYWFYDGTNYLPYTSDESTAWYLENTTADAGSNKESRIRRPGTVIVGSPAVFSNDYKLYTNFNTALDSYASTVSNKALYASVNAMMNRGANPQSQITSLYNPNYNYSTGALTNQYGVWTNVRNFGGNIGTILGDYVYTLNDATATGNVTSMYGLSLAANQNAPGTMSNYRGISNFASIGVTAGVPTNSYGYISGITNNSTNAAPAGSTTFAGFQSSVNNFGIAKFTNIYGGYFSTANGVNAGAPTIVYGLRNDFTNSATTTDAINGIYGYSSTINHNGDSPVSVQRALLISNVTGTTATTGIPNTMESINVSSLLRTQQVGASSALHGISNGVINSSAVSVAGSYGYNGTVINSGSGVTTTLRGINNAISNSTTGTGNTALSAYYSTLTHTANNNTAAILGDYIGINNSGKISSNYNTRYDFSNSSTQGNTISSLHGLYSTLNTTSASNDNVVNSFGLYSANTFSSTGSVTGTFAGGQIHANNTATGSGTVASQQGLYIGNTLNATVANVTSNYGQYIYNNINTAFGGVLSDNYGLRIVNRMAGTGTITNSYGIYLDNMTATNVTGGNWSIFSANTAPSNLAGSLRFSTLDSNGSNHIYSSQGFMNLGNLRSSAALYLGRGLKADPVNNNLYVSTVAGNVSRTAVVLGSGVITFIGQTATENVAVDGAITAPVEIMRVNSLTQRVGIGNASPDMKLSVEESGSSNFIARFQNSSTTSTNPYTAIRLGTSATASGTGYADLVVSGSAGKNIFGISYSNGSGNLAGSTGADADVDFAIASNGNIGIGTTTPKTKLHVTGLPVYADNTAAKAALGGAGVAEGAFFHTGDGLVRVVF